MPQQPHLQLTALLLAPLLALVAPQARAHDPIFGIGPHVLFKDGIEVATDLQLKRQGSARETELALELTYGISGDWAAGIELPYDWKRQGGDSNRGRSDLALFTKYRFWLRDSLGLQESAAVLLKLESDSAASGGSPDLGSGSNDAILGLTYGYEGRKWYRWASLRYRHNGKNGAGLQPGDVWLIDLVGGIRPTPTQYLQPDTVWLLELNGELGERSKLNGTLQANSGGSQWFLSPGLFWTSRNFALKAGIQIPIASDLNGNQQESDYRARLTLEWHL